jgi:glycosyltransferase involved in cell wall biosynthesis
MNSAGHRILFLYSELAGYFLACAKALGNHPGVESVDIIHWPMHPEAPFRFESTSEYKLHLKAEYNRQGLRALVEQLQPTAIICSGWMDTDYNSIAKDWCNVIPVVLTLDNWWSGSMKQWLAVITSPFFIKRRFNKAWIPGEPQRPFAERLGFRGKDLATGFYCADPEPFLKVWESRKLRAPSNKILYVGRYLEFKGIKELWAAFADLSPDFPELWDERTTHPKIFHHGFKQPDELVPFLVDAACFVMPSKKEPWGVVMHEMAIAGIPLLASESVGAATQFLEGDKSGFMNSTDGIRKGLKEFISQTPLKRAEMTKRSHEVGISHLPQNWAESCIKLFSNA